MKRKYICSSCAYSQYVVLPCVDVRTMSIPYVHIDDEKYKLIHFSPSHAVKCSKCGRRCREVFMPLNLAERSRPAKSSNRRRAR
jgi:hypothetical protein